MKTYKNIEVSGKKFKNGKTFNWLYTFILDGKIIGTKICSLKQNRLEMMAFNFCLDNGLYELV